MLLVRGFTWPQFRFSLEHASELAHVPSQALAFKHLVHGIYISPQRPTQEPDVSPGSAVAFALRRLAAVHLRMQIYVRTNPGIITCLGFQTALRVQLLLHGIT